MFRGYAGAAVSNLDALMTKVEAEVDEPADNIILEPELAAASKQL